MHDGLDRSIGIDFRVDERDIQAELRTTNDKLRNHAVELTRSLGNLVNHNDYMRAREANHRSIAEKTFSKLLLWAILEGVVVILVAGAQIMYLRRFIEVRRYF